MRVESRIYPEADKRRNNPLNLDHRDKLCKIRFDLREMGLSTEQRERFVFLLGPRYSGTPINKIVYGKYHTYAENYVKCFEQFREIYWESIRAPDRWAVMMRNPYRRE